MIYFANITSFSSKAQAYLTQQYMQLYHVIMLCELHRIHSSQVISKFKNTFKRTAYVNPSTPSTNSTEGHHNTGGEAIAVLKHLCTAPVLEAVLQSIIDTSGRHLNFAACTISLHGYDILLITAYLLHSEGMSENNNLIMQQIMLLVHVMNLPFILVGDFNMPPASMQDSGWLTQLKAEILVPNVCSTLINSVCSLIDYAIVSYQIKSIIAFLEPDFSAP